MKQMAKVKFAKKNIKWEIKQKHAPTGSQNKSFLIPQPSSNFLSLTEQKSWQKCNIIYMSQMLYAGQSARPSVTFLSDF